MISKTVILFVFGATIAAGQFMPRLITPIPVIALIRSSGCPPAPEQAPVICQFMQTNMGLHYKPQLIGPSTYIPPLVVEKCDSPQLEIKLPERKPIVIPEAPILPPITVPKFPVPMIVEKPMPPPVVVEPCEPAFVSEVSAVNIPSAPSLPPLEMPALPEIVEQHGGVLSEAVVNEIDYQSMVVPQPPAFGMPEVSVVGMPEYIQPLAPIPTAPGLPPVRQPEIPVRVEIPPQPIVPPMIIEQHIEEPCVTGDLMVQGLGSVIPQAPKLPEPMPVLPAYPQPAIMAEPCDPSVKLVEIAEQPYFARNSPSYMLPSRMSSAFLPARSVLVKNNVFSEMTVPYMRYY